MFKAYEAVCTGIVSAYGLVVAGFTIYAYLRLVFKGDD